MILLRIFAFKFLNYSLIYTGLFKNLKARILKSIITWSTMGKQTTQAKEVYLAEKEMTGDKVLC